jgi:dienelactone hydrolase
MMAIEQRNIPHDFSREELESVLVADGTGQALPGIIIIPSVMGITELEIGWARDLVGRGYTVFIADIFGKQFRGAARDVMFGEMNRIGGDRAALRDRLLSVLDVARGKPEIDANRIAVMGFCFGGKCALDLARTGSDIAGVASFHGLFDPPGLSANKISAKIVCYHGWDDPMVTPDAVVALARELTEADADWQIHAYGHTGHGFTNPKATTQIGIPGVEYQAASARRSFAALHDFLGELFG